MQWAKKKFRTRGTAEYVTDLELLKSYTEQNPSLSSKTL